MLRSSSASIQLCIMVLMSFLAQTLLSQSAILSSLMRSSRHEVDYWVVVNVRNAASNWRWEERWCKKKRPRCPKLLIKKPTPKSKRTLYPLKAWLRIAGLEEYINDVLCETPQHYLHPSELPQSPTEEHAPS